ncbi:hypothetical protein DB88DRAFT_493778 [Papiliotrema laurentii]|uniref:ER membrane protein complex subunit 2 n=1 Tax=Papiliotrema laurentii TaxID=5418 RepID=A0AAD9FPQ3_PAPLA|nr:hypothetical protein DB88DRAFT_493778 [Papiliotrema laurentii]
MSQDLEQLARWRTVGARHSQEVIKLAQRALKGGRLGEQEWAVREQLAIAAMDMGRIKLADEQLSVLEKQFSGSPRVALLLGLRAEAKGETDKAKKMYEDLLAKDETNVSAHQRLIALHLPTPTSAIPLLLTYLDTFYTDPAGWSLLAELYADQGLYAQSLTALGHVMVIQSWDSGAVCRAGETAYTLGDYQLALKYYLRAVEMQTDPDDRDSAKKNTRAWWGIKLSIARLMDGGSGESAVPPEHATTPAQLKQLDELTTERLLAAGGAGLTARRAVLAPVSDIKR